MAAGVQRQSSVDEGSADEITEFPQQSSSRFASDLSTRQFLADVVHRPFECLVDQLAISAPMTVAAAFDRDDFVRHAVTFQFAGH
jgi:hypothetical protein